MDRFQEMQVFAAVAQAQGFSAAARHLGMSAASVTRAVAALEKRIGTQLLTRTTRSVHRSEAGQRYLEELSENSWRGAGSRGFGGGQSCPAPWAVNGDRPRPVWRSFCHTDHGELPDPVS